jgi:uncharacterized protein YacL (UPF0231 family)
MDGGEVEKENIKESENCSTLAEIDAGLIGNEKLGQHQLKGNILCIRPCRLWQNPDTSMVENSINDLVKWGSSLKLLKENDEHSKDRITSIVGLGALFAPEIKSYNHSLGMMYLFFIIFVFDDLMDKASDLNKFKQTDIKQAINNFKDIFEGKFESLPDREQVAFPSYESLCNAMFAFREHCVAHIAGYKNKNSYFVKDIINYFQSVVIQHEDEGSPISEGNFLFFRNFTVAAKPFLEHLAIINDIKLDKEIRKNLRFIRFRESAANVLAITNDLNSVGKEINENQNSNLVLVKANNKNIDLLKAFRETNNYLNNEIIDLINQGQILRKNFPLNIDLQKYISMTENGVDGHLRWYGSEYTNGRYGDIKFALRDNKESLAGYGSIDYSNCTSGSVYVKKKKAYPQTKPTGRSPLFTNGLIFFYSPNI